jgi:hypothetical protein
MDAVADWFVYEHDAAPSGPWSTEVICRAILEGRLAQDIWVAAPSGNRWLRALDVPVIARGAFGAKTASERTLSESSPSARSATMMMPLLEERWPDEDPAPTDPCLPPIGIP